MKLFSRLFGTPSAAVVQPDVRFGRYSDSYKTEANYDAWDEALTLFEAENPMAAYHAFFRYLRDEAEDNVRCWDEPGGLRFELYQGSKRVSGFADLTKFKAEAKIALTGNLGVGVMRRLMEHNFNLKFSRFALDGEGHITIVFDTHVLDGSPYKIYYALKELATNADKQDDLLLDEFGTLLQPVQTDHLRPLSEEERGVKYQFVRHKIESVLAEVENGALDGDAYPGGMAYLLLDAVYRLDYLVSPQGYMMEALERMHRTYFAKDEATPVQKYKALAKELKSLLERSEEDFHREFYRVPATFGITTPVGHDRLVALVEAELPHADWYTAQGYEAVALAIPGYIVGLSMFNYAMPLPDRELFELYYQIVEADYFRQLGFTLDYYDPATGRFNARAIRRAIDCVVDDNQAQYPQFRPNTALLDFGSLPAFAFSFLQMVKEVNATKAG